MTMMSEARRRSSTHPLDPDTQNRYTSVVYLTAMTHKSQEETDKNFLTRIVVDTSLRKFYLYSNQGETREIKCDTSIQFLDVLQLVRTLIQKKDIVYAEPLIDTKK